MFHLTDQSYHRSVGDKITMPCGAIGSPQPVITWRRVSWREIKGQCQINDFPFTRTG